MRSRVHASGTPMPLLADFPVATHWVKALVFEGRRRADATPEFLRREFPRIFAGARIRACGNPGIGCMTPPEADNLVAAGRCLEGDSHALSAIRVMGPCIAMGTAAAHALDVAGTGSVHSLDLAALQRRLHDNLQRRD